jgi:hypothetical protein
MILFYRKRGLIGFFRSVKNMILFPVFISEKNEQRQKIMDILIQVSSGYVDTIIPSLNMALKLKSEEQM